MAALLEHEGARDFDFLSGSWQVRNDRLISRLTNSDEWEQFEAIGKCELVLGGLGNVDRMIGTWRGTEFEGLSLRLFSPATGQWSIYWADSSSGELLPPVVGRFVDGVGEFYGDDQHEGQPVFVRYRWSEITTKSARWEQAFSTDQGETWETNWIMTFTRRQADEQTGETG